MSSSQHATGFASIVLERQTYGLLVAPTINPDLADRAGDRVMRFTTVPEAIDAAARFLEAWAAEVGRRRRAAVRSASELIETGTACGSDQRRQLR
jgi:hypothetical protein